MRKQTIRKEIRFSGIGVHGGQKVDLRLIPSFEGKINFLRIDKVRRLISISPESIEIRNSSILVAENCRIRTIEHLMAALYALRVSSLTVELNGDEIPILDGSAQPFTEAIKKAGTRSLDEDEKIMRIQKSFSIDENDSFIKVDPADDFIVSYRIKYDHPVINTQEISLKITPDNFRDEIAPARTFGFSRDETILKAQGLALGASLENTIVLNETDVINKPLRFPDEFVRHKVLDFLGDISMLGFNILGHFKIYKAGHHLHLKTVRFLHKNTEYLETYP